VALEILILVIYLVPLAYFLTYVLTFSLFLLMSILKDEDRYKILKLLSENTDMNQRQLAASLGVSLGKTNYCLKALIQKGMIKAGSFRSNPNKQSYAYLLTPKGIDEKARVTLSFLNRKQAEFEALQIELDELRQEAAQIAQENKICLP